MRTSAEELEVVNALTAESDWISKLREAMKSRREIAFIATFLDRSKTEGLRRLCQEEDYHEPETVPEARWNEIKTKLNLGGLAKKEQSVDRNHVYLLHPRIA
ncbi:MAG: hypothetical protein AB1813_13790 [Verrucomicrobiota bacterium]